MHMSLYLLGGLMLMLAGLVLFVWGLLFIQWDYLIFIDWEVISVNSCSITMTLLLDWMSLLFMASVLLISSMVVFYSEDYMSSDINSVRFLFLVLLFILSMMLMILSPNLISILIGWDGLGLVSYALVIYFQNYKSYSAGMLTILTNRIGDVAILIAISWLFNFGSWHYIYYTGMLEHWSLYLMILVVLAAFTKSAQIPFSSWLPAAMAAPTPVSALVHSSTLVTAGVYLLIRFSNLFLSFDCSLLVMLGMMTMFMAGLGASFEFDLSKIIALSTLSQLGLMMSVLFLGFSNLAFFHLLVHAFFKALLFLCAGLIIHMMSDSQDIRHMGGVVNYIPYTCACFCISNLSLCGLPFMSGFYSKDLLLELMIFDHYNFFVYLVFYISVGLTSCYTMRLMYYCIFGCTNMYSCQSYNEGGVMIYSMTLLTILSVVGGSSLGWLIFSSPNFMVLTMFLKLSAMGFVLTGLYLGYELNLMNYFYKLYTMSMYYMVTFLGSMWFMPKFSTYMIYSGSMLVSMDLYKNMEMGWGEWIISGSMYKYFSYMSSNLNTYMNNNIKMYLISFMFLFILLMI
uniref:NADH-ubiquinone oxidoreductase chain 5 n=1 Tax=Alloeorhynchus sp. TaxID=2931281 RepID=A0A8T9ZY08_9HEMI|nr:NADH dehydrogenase subunit 5 [Alloeorhynchus sp.]